MKVRILHCGFLTLLLAALPIQSYAQVVSLSNLANTPSTSLGASYDMDSLFGAEIAQGFTTGSSSATLTSVTLSMGPAGTSGGGFTVALYDDSGGTPGTPMATLSGNSDPATPNLYTYTASGTLLSANTPYWIVASVPSSGATRNYQWINTGDSSVTSQPGWTLGSAAANFSLNGSSINGWSVQSSFQQLSISVVPEPAATGVIMGGVTLGVLAINQIRRRKGLRA